MSRLVLVQYLGPQNKTVAVLAFTESADVDLAASVALLDLGDAAMTVAPQEIPVTRNVLTQLLKAVKPGSDAAAPLLRVGFIDKPAGRTGTVELSEAEALDFTRAAQEAISTSASAEASFRAWLARTSLAF